jgi:LAS superfamily LD-carboxypeptidase LdcB
MKKEKSPNELNNSKKIILSQFHLLGLLILITAVIVIGLKVALKYFTKGDAGVSNGEIQARNNNIRFTLLKETPLYSSPDINDVLVETLERGIKIVITERVKNKWTFIKTMINNRERWLIEQFLQLTPISVEQGQNLPIGNEGVNINNPLPFDYKPTDLEKIPLKYLSPYDTRTHYLRKEVLQIISKLIDEANKSGIKIRIISAYRSADYQLKLYQNALRKKKNPDWKGTAKPTYSEHQLGTAVDLSSSENDYDLTENFENTRAFKWIMENKDRFGIVLSYNRYNKEGYIYEPWHFRYIGK